MGALINEAGQGRSLASRRPPGLAGCQRPGKRAPHADHPLRLRGSRLDCAPESPRGDDACSGQGAHHAYGHRAATVLPPGRTKRAPLTLSGCMSVPRRCVFALDKRFWRTLRTRRTKRVTLGIGLKIMVSPVRVRVSPLRKCHQNAGFFFARSLEPTAYHADSRLLP